jgi:hypothetical protein
MILVIFIIWLLLLMIGLFTKINIIFSITDQIQLLIITLLIFKNFTQNKIIENNNIIYSCFIVYLILYLFFLKDIRYIDLFIFFLLNILFLIYTRIANKKIT